MRDRKRYFEVDLTTPTAVVYFNGMIVHNAKAWWWMWSHVPKIPRRARETEGFLQIKPGVTSPREIHLMSYWRDDDALRRFYTHPEHVEMMRLTFSKPDWFTLYNETYSMPVSTRYWNGRNGYALSQAPQADTLEAFYDRVHTHPDVTGTGL
jgi:heme-degrading monooxygenase HmoA